MKNFFEGKNILVAGGVGFVGTNLVQQLVKLNANVTSTYYNSTPNDQSICNYIKSPRFVDSKILTNIRQ